MFDELTEDFAGGDFVRLPKAPRRRRSEQTPRETEISRKNSISLTRSTGRKSCSKSMTDLFSSQTEKKPNGARRRKPYAVSVTKPEVLKRTKMDSNETEAARRVQNVLILNAWRRRRESHKDVQAAIRVLAMQVENLQMQIYVLRQLLENEKMRVVFANEDIHNALNSLERCEHEKSLVLEEKEQLEIRVYELEDRVSELENKCRNQKNDLLTIRSESKSWETQLGREREKLRQMEEGRQALKEEVRYRENVLMLQTKNLEKLTQTNKDLQAKLEAHVPLWDETMAQVDSANEKLRRSEDTQREQRLTLEEKEDQVRDMRAKMVELEKRMRRQDEQNGELGKSISEKNEELSNVQQKLKELTERHRTWSGRVIRVASICARVPAACFYTLALLLLPTSPHKKF